MDEKRAEVNRKDKLTTEELIAHIKAVGQAIINDAESIAINPRNLTGITIEADIAPLQQVTEVIYRYSRLSDPRIK